MKPHLILMMTILLTACGNPGDVTDAEYATFKGLAAPKILYACHSTPRFDTIPCNEFLPDANKHLSCLKTAMENPKSEVTVGYAAGVGFAVTYNKLLTDAQASCFGTLKVLESKS